MIGMDLSGCVQKKRVKVSLVFGIFSYILYFITSSEFHIHQSHMGTWLSEVIKFCTRKTIKKKHFMSKRFHAKCKNRTLTFQISLLYLLQ